MTDVADTVNGPGMMSLTQPPDVRTPAPSDESHSTMKRTSMSRSALPPLHPHSSPHRIPTRTVNFKDRFTKTAAANLGFLPSDLEYPLPGEANTYTQNPKLRDVVFRELIGRVDERINEVEAERARVADSAHRIRTAPLNPNSRETSLARAQTAGTEVSFAKLEQRRLARAEERNRREIEQIILESLTQKFIVEKLEERQALEDQKRVELEVSVREQHQKEREDARKREEFFEQQKKDEAKRNKEYRLAEEEKERKYQEMKGQQEKELRQKALEEERHRQERAAQTQALIRKMEEDRKMAQMHKLEVLEEREARRREAVAAERAQQLLENEERDARRSLALRNVLTNKRRLLAEMKQRADAKEAHIQTILRQHEVERMQQMTEFRNREAEKIKRQAAFREELERKRLQQVLKLNEKDERATKILADIQQKYRERAQKAIEGDSEIQHRLDEKRATHEATLKEKRIESDARLARKAEMIAEAREKLAEQREEHGVIRQLQDEKVAYSVTRQARKDDVKRREIETRYTQKVKQIEEFERIKQETLAAKLKQREAISREKARIYATVQHSLSRAGVKNITELRQVAERYGLDYDAIEARARNPRAARRSVAEFVRSLGGETAQKDWDDEEKSAMDDETAQTDEQPEDKTVEGEAVVQDVPGEALDASGEGQPAEEKTPAEETTEEPSAKASAEELPAEETTEEPSAEDAAEKSPAEETGEEEPSAKDVAEKSPAEETGEEETVAGEPPTGETAEEPLAKQTGEEQTEEAEPSTDETPAEEPPTGQADEEPLAEERATEEAPADETGDEASPAEGPGETAPPTEATGEAAQPPPEEVFTTTEQTRESDGEEEADFETEDQFTQQQPAEDPPQSDTAEPSEEEADGDSIFGVAATDSSAHDEEDSPEEDAPPPLGEVGADESATLSDVIGGVLDDTDIAEDFEIEEEEGPAETSLPDMLGRLRDNLDDEVDDFDGDAEEEGF